MKYYQNTNTQWVGLPLYRKGEVIEYALVDLADLPRIFAVSNKWKINSNGYAFCRKGSEPNRELVLLHRLLMDNPESYVDHINRNRLDNRRLNLRLATQGQNALNRGKLRTPKAPASPYKGVTRQRDGAWVARLGINGVRHYLGRFRTQEEAAQAYDHAARQLHKEFAVLNF